MSDAPKRDNSDRQADVSVADYFHRLIYLFLKNLFLKSFNDNYSNINFIYIAALKTEFALTDKQIIQAKYRDPGTEAEQKQYFRLD